ncbi:NUDIX domain-containing protein [Peribacillus sp. SCS-26]|uniref:NUDIX domain-containing protein n=1 Tax=Paraperibacillus marinus TaxID=3115295 RepID=UPI003906B83B
MNIRNSVKAVIIKGGQVLLTKNEDQEGIFYLFPGGGQEHGETFHQALTRECMEETGLRVEAGSLLFIREYIGRTHEYAAEDKDVHQVEFYFACRTDPGAESAANPALPDTYQIGTEWVNVERLIKYRLYPRGIRQKIIDFHNGQIADAYLGNIN